MVKMELLLPTKQSISNLALLSANNLMPINLVIGMQKLLGMDSHVLFSESSVQYRFSLQFNTIVYSHTAGSEDNDVQLLW